MSQIIEVKVPDIGNFSDVPVIEVLVKPGDAIKAEDALITLESDKATMDVPSPAAGTVKEIKVKIGDKVSEGSLVLLLDSAAAGAAAPAMLSVSPPPAAASSHGGVVEVRVPDIGDFKNVPIIEVLVKPGDAIKAEQPLITLESDKATMDVPAPLGGVVGEIKVQVGEKVSEGTIILTLSTGAASAAAAPAATAPAAAPTAAAPVAATPAAGIDETAFKLAYAGPGVRKLARELGVDLGQVKGSGNKGRITKEDVQSFAKGGGAAAAPGASAAAGAGVGGLELLPWPKVDFAKFGPVESQAAVAHQEDFGREPAPQLGDDPARHQQRRGRHHRSRSIPRPTQQGNREERRPGEHARVHDQGGGGDAQKIPRVQRLD